MALPTVTMLAPPSFGGVVTGTPSGTVYVPNAYGFVQAFYQDVNALSLLGFDIQQLPQYTITIITTTTCTTGVIGRLLGANMNVTTDQPIPLFVSSTQLYRVQKITVTNASTSLTTAAGGVYDAASKGGNAIVAAAQVYTALTTTFKALDLTIALNLREPAATLLYLALTTAQGAAATADVYVYGDILTQ